MEVHWICRCPPQARRDGNCLACARREDERFDGARPCPPQRTAGVPAWLLAQASALLTPARAAAVVGKLGPRTGRCRGGGDHAGCFGRSSPKCWEARSISLGAFRCQGPYRSRTGRRAHGDSTSGRLGKPRSAMCAGARPTDSTSSGPARHGSPAACGLSVRARRKRLRRAVRADLNLGTGAVRLGETWSAKTWATLRRGRCAGLSHELPVIGTGRSQTRREGTCRERQESAA
jgi:hypothetical protein